MCCPNVLDRRHGLSGVSEHSAIVHLLDLDCRRLLFDLRPRHSASSARVSRSFGSFEMSAAWGACRAAAMPQQAVCRLWAVAAME